MSHYSEANMVTPVELILMLARRSEHSLMRWLMEDEAGNPDWSRIPIILGVLFALVVFKRVVKHLRNRNQE